MKTINHLFVCVVDRPEDPFIGIRHVLSKPRLARHTFSEVRLPAESYETVRKTEYSARRYCRVLYYKSVFEQLNERLIQATAGATPDNPCVIYFSDEGVWAEFLRDFRKRHPEMRALCVDVQHGFAYPVTAKYRKLRQRVNWFTRKLWGYPIFGMGSLGGVGGGVFDVYLTYDKEASDFVRKHTGGLAYASPLIIKHALLERFTLARQSVMDNCGGGQEVMFALQPSIDYIKGSTLDVFRELAPLAKLLAEKYGRRLFFRPHPGMQQGKVMEAFRQSGIDFYTDMAELSELAEHLARCSVVMSYDSTVLWEAYVLGLVPVSVLGSCYRRSLPYPHEVIETTSPVGDQLEKVLRPETAEKYRCEVANEDFDWENIIVSLVADTVTAEADGRQPICCLSE
jgi:hypothetical protein